METLLHNPIPGNPCVGCRVGYKGPVPTFEYAVGPEDVCDVLMGAARGELHAFFLKRLSEQPARTRFEPKALAFALLCRMCGIPKEEALAEFRAASDQLRLRTEDRRIPEILEYVYAPDCPEVHDLRSFRYECRISGSDSHFDIRYAAIAGECGEDAESSETDRPLR